MYDFDKMDKRYIIFGNIFLLANRLQTVMNNSVQELTAKQWLVAMMLGMFDEPPTLKQLARICDSSHQNTKQLVSKLEAKGFVRIENDSKDLRAMRIFSTDKWEKWNENNSENATQFMKQMFNNLSDEEISVMNQAQQKIYKNLDIMEENLR